MKTWRWSRPLRGWSWTGCILPQYHSSSVLPPYLWGICSIQTVPISLCAHSLDSSHLVCNVFNSLWEQHQPHMNCELWVTCVEKDMYGNMEMTWWWRTFFGWWTVLLLDEMDQWLTWMWPWPFPASYGYRGRDCRANLYFLPTGEAVYFIACVVVLYHIKNRTQRHYTNHTDCVRWSVGHNSFHLHRHTQWNQTHSQSWRTCFKHHMA